MSPRFEPGNTKATQVTDAQVYEIKDKYLNQGYTQGRLAREYGLSINTIGRYVRGESRQKVTPPAPTLTSEELQAIAENALRIQEELTRKPVRVDKDLGKFLDNDRAAEYGVKK